MITPWQRRRNDRRRFMHGYDTWLARRVGEDGGVGWLVRNELEQHGDAVLTWRADMEYQRKCRRYRPYAMKREKRHERGPHPHGSAHEGGADRVVRELG